MPLSSVELCPAGLEFCLWHWPASLRVHELQPLLSHPTSQAKWCVLVQMIKTRLSQDTLLLSAENVS